MPIYEYVCQTCGETFDHWWRSVAAAQKAVAAGESLACPACGSSETRRRVSQVAVLGGLGGLTPGEQQGVKAQEERLASITPKEQIQQFQANREQKRRTQQA